MIAPVACEPRLTPSEQVALARLTRAANAGAICPSNDELAAAIGAASISTASSVVSALARKGVIAVRRFQQARQVTIAATGRSTAMPAHVRPHWRDRPTAEPKPKPAPAIDRLAEVMARKDYASLTSAAYHLNLPVARVEQLWAEIRRGLGPQAI